jgi:hypothetical protein
LHSMAGSLAPASEIVGRHTFLYWQTTPFLKW